MKGGIIGGGRGSTPFPWRSATTTPGPEAGPGGPLREIHPLAPSFAKCPSGGVARYGPSQSGRAWGPGLTRCARAAGPAGGSRRPRVSLASSRGPVPPLSLRSPGSPANGPARSLRTGGAGPAGDSRRPWVSLASSRGPVPPLSLRSPGSPANGPARSLRSGGAGHAARLAARGSHSLAPLAPSSTLLFPHAISANPREQKNRALSPPNARLHIRITRNLRNLLHPRANPPGIPPPRSSVVAPPHRKPPPPPVALPAPSPSLPCCPGIPKPRSSVVAYKNSYTLRYDPGRPTRPASPCRRPKLPESRRINNYFSYRQFRLSVIRPRTRVRAGLYSYLRSRLRCRRLLKRYDVAALHCFAPFFPPYNPLRGEKKFWGV